ncbi:MAG: hypothetical protein HC835_16945 [Oscillatoriales cyanobacterium RM2_1_1]|nr:hypothetical protein [Oscillatoriales cyanobacterium RM2_1_1]
MVNEAGKTSNIVGWKPYDLDYYAQELVLEFRNTEDVLNESHKMRMTIAYGLERFWGEQLRLERENQTKAQYWSKVWAKLQEILINAGMQDFPNDNVKSNNPDDKVKKEEEITKIKEMAKKIWSMTLDDQRVALMVLTQFCDSLVWWTQRYKIKKEK